MKETPLPEPRWKRFARESAFLLVIASALPLGLAAYFEIQAHKNGSPQPTAEKTVESVQHGDRKYISPAEAERNRLMWTIFFIGFPSAVLLAFVLRFGFGVDIMKEEAMPEWVDKLVEDLKKTRNAKR
ncbi:MAG: hypothetical protein M3384_10255 [Acidobacteriota bacterium]|nr:hypothetical protein [Acidobacteriota bacterium]